MKAGTTASNQWAWAEPPCRKQSAGRPGAGHSRALSRSLFTVKVLRTAEAQPKAGGVVVMSGILYRGPGDLPVLTPTCFVSRAPQLADVRFIDGRYIAGLVGIASLAGMLLFRRSGRTTRDRVVRAREEFLSS